MKLLVQPQRVCQSRHVRGMDQLALRSGNAWSPRHLAGQGDRLYLHEAMPLEPHPEKAALIILN